MKIFDVEYLCSGKEAQPRPLGEDHGVVVFHYKPSSQVNYFSRSVAGGSQPAMEPVRTNLGPDTLMFESRFESGNLEKVVRITDTYYELHLRQDFYTTRHCQWFYFQVTRSIRKYISNKKRLTCSGAEHED